MIASGKTDESGRFSIEGDSSRFGGTDSAIDPHLRIYHKCDEPETKVSGPRFRRINPYFQSGFRKIELRYPRDFVTLGRVPRRTYNIGSINLELGFPKESREKELLKD